MENIEDARDPGLAFLCRLFAAFELDWEISLILSGARARRLQKFIHRPWERSRARASAESDEWLNHAAALVGSVCSQATTIDSSCASRTFWFPIVSAQA